MGKFVSITDFTGIKNISQNSFTKKDLNFFIDNYEEEYLQDLLGCELYDLFIADLDINNMPQTQIYIDIFEPFCIDDDCNMQWRSKGMPEMLKCFIYWEFVLNQKYVNTITGVVVGNNENSRETFNGETQIYSTYNKGINSYDAIQRFICDNSENYPTYNGRIKESNAWF